MVWQMQDGGAIDGTEDGGTVIGPDSNLRPLCRVHNFDSWAFQVTCILANLSAMLKGKRARVLDGRQL